MRRFEGRVVIVTGASSGIGEAAATQFGAQGAKVVVAARRVDKGEQVVRRIEEAGGEAVFMQTDVTRRAEVEALVERTVARYGRLDCAVNNAGISGPVLTPVADIEEEGWDTLMNTNLKAVWMCMKYEIRAMLQQPPPVRASIVNISSIYGFKASDLGHAPYCASKFALIGLSKSAAIDYAQQGIRVNVVAPGFTHSEMVDSAPVELLQTVALKYSAMNRLGEADETAEAITWLCSDAARFVNGAVLPVDGGDTARLY
jgi:A-factor type gamma-butyrolactone 1'-reductase (1S-forming)